MDSEVDRLLSLAHDGLVASLDGSSVPSDHASALRYAERLETRHHDDLRKMLAASERLRALAERCRNPRFRRRLLEVEESLR